jgi:hypothetical protein
LSDVFNRKERLHYFSFFYSPSLFMSQPRKRTLSAEDRSPSPPRVRPSHSLIVEDTRVVQQSGVYRRVIRADLPALFADRALYFTVPPRDVCGVLERFLFGFKRGKVRNVGALKFCKAVEMQSLVPMALRAEPECTLWLVCVDDDHLTFRTLRHDIDTTRARISLDGEQSGDAVRWGYDWEPRLVAPSGRVFGILASKVSGLQQFVVVLENDTATALLKLKMCRYESTLEMCINSDESVLYMLDAQLLYIYDMRESRIVHTHIYDYRQVTIFSVAVLSDDRAVVLGFDNVSEEPVLTVLDARGNIVETVVLPFCSKTKRMCVDAEDNLYFCPHIYSLAERRCVGALPLAHTSLSTGEHTDLRPVVVRDGRVALIDVARKQIYFFE